MPVLRKTTIERTKAEEFVDRLIEEWRHPQQGATEPVIIEESPGSSNRVSHLYVVWNDWRDLTPIQRSQVIMQAYERIYGKERALSITVSMGLIPEEADRMKISYK